MPGVAITGAAGPTAKPNESRVFFHDGAWWGCFFDGLDWFLYQRVSAGSWTKQTGTGALDLRTAARPDCWIDSASNTLYIFFHHTTGSRFFRLTYAAGAFTKDAAATDVAVPGIKGSSDEETSFTRAKNGTLFAFGYDAGNQIVVNWSTDGGATWQAAATTIKSGLSAANGLTDCMPFTWNGVDWVGVFAGENTIAATGVELYHFLRLKDGDAPGTVANWVDETGAIPQPTAPVEADDHVHLKVGADNTLYAIAKTSGSTGTQPGIVLFVRDTVTPTAGWVRHTVTTVDEAGGLWTRPALLIDDANGELYALATIEGISSTKVQYKKSALASLATLSAQPRIDLIGPNATDDFDDPSVAALNPTPASGALVVAYNATAATLWEALLTITSPSGVALSAALAAGAGAGADLAAPAAFAADVTSEAQLEGALGQAGGLAATIEAASGLSAEPRAEPRLAAALASAATLEAAATVGTGDTRLAAALAGIGMAAIGSFPVAGSTAPPEPGLFLFIDGIQLGNELRAGTLQFTDFLEQRDTCEWQHQLLAGGTLPRPGQRVVLRNRGANQFNGTIERTEEVRLSGSTALVTQVEAIDLKGVPERRLVDQGFMRTAIAAGTVITDLVTTFLAGEGITTNSVQAGPPINAVFNKFERTVAQAFDEVAEAVGFTWYVDANSDLHFEARTTSRAPFTIAASYRGVVLGDGPIAYWRLGELSGTTAADDSGNGHTGTYSGAPTLGVAGLVDGDANTAVTFDGVDDQISVTGFTGSNPAHISMEAWIQPDVASGGVFRNLFNFAGLTTDVGLWIGQTGASDVLFTSFEAGTIDDSLTGPTALVMGAIAHVVATYDGTTMRLYLNGSLEAAKTHAAGGPLTWSGNPTPGWTFGAAGGASNFWGVLDEVAVYGYALSPAQVQAHYEAGLARFAAPNALEGVRVVKSRERYRNRVTVRYMSGLTTNVTRDDQVEQSSRAALEGGTGIYHMVEDAPALTTPADATARAEALLRRFAAIPAEVRFQTRTPGLRAGQLLTIGLLAHGIDGDFLLDQVVLRDLGNQDLVYEVVALSGEHLGGDRTFWQKLER